MCYLVHAKYSVMGTHTHIMRREVIYRFKKKINKIKKNKKRIRKENGPCIHYKKNISKKINNYIKIT